MLVGDPSDRRIPLWCERFRRPGRLPTGFWGTSGEQSTRDSPLKLLSSTAPWVKGVDVIEHRELLPALSVGVIGDTA
jgi:hypothetical protein